MNALPTESADFHAHHSPAGAYFSFTCGKHGVRGGLGVELGKPAAQDIFIGFKDGNRYADAPLKVLPFFQGADQLDPRAAFLAATPGADRERLSPFLPGEITRQYGYATDRWIAGDLEFSIYTPFPKIPDPTTAASDELANALLPAITAELLLDNRTGKGTKTVFFAINFHDAGLRLLTNLPKNHAGVAFRQELGFSGHAVEFLDKGTSPTKICPFPFIKWWPHEGLEDRSNPVHLLGTCGGIALEVPPEKRFSLRLALGCHLANIVTTGLEGRYFYNRHYSGIEQVLMAASRNFCDLKRSARRLDERLAASGLSTDQQFLIAHSVRSYYGNTQLLDVAGEPYWIVNEGEYRMMNTLDLAVDQVFWELDQNPWVVRNLLDNFLKRYSYIDEVKIGTTESTEFTEKSKEKSSVGSVSFVVKSVSPRAPGGLSFTHDQGTHNQFSPPGTSAYELKDLTGCFSYMTQEQLCNWILIAASYVCSTGDLQWLHKNGGHIDECQSSMLQRDSVLIYSDGGPPGYSGLMTRDSALTGTGSEITTYDSLDESLGSAVGNLYLATKCWASHIGLALLKAYLEHGPDWPKYGEMDGLVENCIESADATSDAILKKVNLEKWIPANLDQAKKGSSSRILPAIEPTTFLAFWQACRLNQPNAEVRNWLSVAGRFKELLSTFRTHTVTLLADPEHRNKFPDGGIKLSSASDNSWLSKIAIVQHVARSLFNLDEDGKERPPQANASGWEKSDAAHIRWLTTGPATLWAACDQIVNGQARGSKYYPRLVTTALWLRECQSTQEPTQ